MHLKAGEKVLDMGCGWGSLAVHMAKQFQADVTGTIHLTTACCVLCCVAWHELNLCSVCCVVLCV